MSGLGISLHFSRRSGTWKNIRCSILYLIIEHIYSTYFFYLFSTYFYILDAAFRLYIPTSLPASFSIRLFSRHQFLYCIPLTFSTYFLPTFSWQLFDMIFIQTSRSFFTIFYLLFLPLFYLFLHFGCSFSIIYTFAKTLSTAFNYLHQYRHLSRYDFFPDIAVSILYSTYFFYLFYLLQASFSVRHSSRHQFLYLYCILPTFSTYFLPTFSLHLFDTTFVQTSLSFCTIFYLLFSTSFLPTFSLTLRMQLFDYSLLYTQDGDIFPNKVFYCLSFLYFVNRRRNNIKNSTAVG